MYLVSDINYISYNIINSIFLQKISLQAKYGSRLQEICFSLGRNFQPLNILVAVVLPLGSHSRLTGGASEID